MATVHEPVTIDTDKLMSFVFRAVDEVGATLNTALVVMGDKLGLYRALAGAGPLSPAELASRTGISERYAQEWLNAQAAGAYLDYDPDSGRYLLPPEQAAALTDENSPAYLPGSSRSPWVLSSTRRGSPRRPRRGPGSVGTTMWRTSTTVANASFAPGTTLI